ncbi:MAG: hypothetical protein WCU88_03670 [Elusimicrobiota bacterium]|jgi:hypothetical protein
MNGSERLITIQFRFTKAQMIALLSGLFLCLQVHEISSEEFTLTTYYPAPYGTYRNLLSTKETVLGRDKAAGSGTNPEYVRIGNKTAAVAAGWPANDINGFDIALYGFTIVAGNMTVGIPGAATPSVLRVNGTVTITGGGATNNRFLMSNATGDATWQSSQPAAAAAACGTMGWGAGGGTCGAGYYMRGIDVAGSLLTCCPFP